MTPTPNAEAIGAEFGALDAAGQDAWLKAFDAGKRKSEEKPEPEAAPMNPSEIPNSSPDPTCKEPLQVDPIVTEPTGGRHSAVPYSFSCFDPAWLLDVAGVLHTGKLKYGAANWKGIGVEAHLNHAVGHVQLYRRDGDRAELLNAACRLMFAFVVDRDGVKEAKA